MSKKNLILLLIGLFLSASCQAVSLDRQEITVSLEENGESSFNEKYFLVIGPAEKSRFINNVEENGKSLVKWKADYDFVFPHFGSTADLQSIDLTFDEEVRLLKLSYSLKTQVAQKIEETARSTTYEIPSSFFDKFIQGTTLEIPTNTQVIIELPKNAVIDQEKITKELQVQGNQLMLQDYRGSNIFIYYSINKPIAPPLDTQELIEQALSNPLNQVFLAMVVALLILAYFWRRKVVDSIEEFIVTYSQIGEQEEEEIEVE